MRRHGGSHGVASPNTLINLASKSLDSRTACSKPLPREQNSATMAKFETQIRARRTNKIFKRAECFAIKFPRNLANAVSQILPAGFQNKRLGIMPYKLNAMPLKSYKIK